MPIKKRSKKKKTAAVAAPKIGKIIKKVVSRKAKPTISVAAAKEWAKKKLGL